jgi:antitoxin VapB
VPPTFDSPETDRLARELAALTGEPVEDAVAAAVRARLERERCRRGRDELLARARRIVRESGPSAPPGGDPTAFLYDERGLPT